MAHPKAYDLSEAEQRDLITLIQQGKALPEKYRFILFEDKRELELVWNGKTRDVCTTVLPFQSLEHVDEPRAETRTQYDLFDKRGRQLAGWTNKLIWGDNKLILSSLKSGPIRQEIEDAGGLKLIYIDPPFDVGADFSIDIEVGGETFHKEANILEQIAYRDTWGRGADSFVAMIYERLILMRDLLSDDGSIYVHVDWRLNSVVRLVLEEVFGRSNYRNEISWIRAASHNDATGQFGRVKDSILYFGRSERSPLSIQYVPYSPDYISAEYRKLPSGRFYKAENMLDPRGAMKAYDFHGTIARWRTKPENLEELWNSPQTEVPDSHGRIKLGKDGKPTKRCRIIFLDEMPGVPLSDNWSDLPYLAGGAKEAAGYRTQKPSALLERIIKASSSEGDLIADFFCGSGTTAAVAERLGRKWIAADLGKFAIHTTRKRLIGIQRELKANNRDFRAFEVLNLGRYERQAYLNVGGRLTGAEKARALARKEADFRALILRAYKSIALGEGSGVAVEDGFFHGVRNGRLVVIGPINLPVGRLFVEEVIMECRRRGASRVDVLAFEYEMGLFPAVLDEAQRKGIDLAPKYIPAEVFDKRAVDKGQVVFHDISFVEATPRYDRKNKFALQIELTDFSVYYTQGAAEAALAALKEGKSDVICEQGQLYKVTKSKGGIVSKDRLTKHWTDWVDYWAVDFDYESRKEIIKQPVELGFGRSPRLPGIESEQAELPAFEEKWTGGYIFENEWQSFRTRQSRKLELITPLHTYDRRGRFTIAVKVIDIFGNDTMTLVPVNVG